MDGLLGQHIRMEESMSTSLISAQGIINWRGELPPIDSDGRLEEVVGTDDFQNPWFLEKGWEKSRPVGLIPRKGTAFLVSDNVLMTNWHVFRREDWAAGKKIIFNVEQDSDGLPRRDTEEFELNPSRLFYSNENLDYAIVYVEGDAASNRGYVNISSQGEISEDSRVNIVQHPNGGLKKIAIRNNGIKYFDSELIQYWADTDHGSSGSPVFDEYWEIIGLHYQHDYIDGTGGTNKIFYNEAHRIDKIYTDILSQGIQLY